MVPRILLAVALSLAAATAVAQAGDPAEITFWESVRDSKNAAELQAYLDQYPNGRFAVLAKARRAALQRPAPSVPATARPAPATKPAPAAAVASFAPSAVTSETRMPQAGDTWTYQLSYPRIRGQWGQPARAPASHVIKVGAVVDGKIVDQLSIDGGSVVETTHSAGSYLAPQGVSVYSPYLVALRDLPATGSVGAIAILDAPCGNAYRCHATGRIAGREQVSVPAGQFLAAKIIVEESWQPASGNTMGQQSSRMNGGRTITIWYVSEIKRAVKFSSRLTVGDIPPIEPHFDLELVSYQVK
jgi:hypothetical protein